MQLDKETVTAQAQVCEEQIDPELKRGRLEVKGDEGVVVHDEEARR